MNRRGKDWRLEVIEKVLQSREDETMKTWTSTAVLRQLALGPLTNLQMRDDARALFLWLSSNVFISEKFSNILLNF